MTVSKANSPGLPYRRLFYERIITVPVRMLSHGRMLHLPQVTGKAGKTPCRAESVEITPGAGRAAGTELSSRRPE